MSVEKKGVKISDAYELISKKILINKLSVENLNTQIKFSHTSAKLQLATVEMARKKLKLVKKLTPILEKQLSEFTEERQIKCVKIYNKINELDTPTDEFKELCNQLRSLEHEMMGLIKKLQYLEAQIPAEKVITNYNIKPKEEPLPTSCAQEMLGVGMGLPPSGL